MKKKTIFRESFPGQTHFPVLGIRIGAVSFIAMIVLAVAIVVVVVWLKS